MKFVFGNIQTKQICLIRLIPTYLVQTDTKMARKFLLWWYHVRYFNIKLLLHFLSWMVLLTEHYRRNSIIGVGLVRSYFIQIIWWKTASVFIWIVCTHAIQVEILFLWDATSRLLSKMVQDNTNELNINLVGIPPGCNSLIQICNMITNKAINQAFKIWYIYWKVHSDPGLGVN